MSNKLMLLPFALLLSSTSSKTNSVTTKECLSQSTCAFTHDKYDEEAFEAPFDFTQIDLGYAKSLKTS